MFDAREALRPLSGKSFKYDKLREELRKIRNQHLAEIPPEFGTREFFLLALHNRWVREGKSGKLRVRLP